MLTSVRGSDRIELCVAFSSVGASTGPSRASFCAWASALGSTCATAAESCSGSSTTPVRRDRISISRPSSRVRSCSSRGSTGATPVGSAQTSGPTLRAISTSSPASALRSMPGSRAAGRSSHSSVAAADVLTSRRASSGRPGSHRLACGLARAPWAHVLVQALGDLDEQAGEKVAVGFDVAQLGEHLLDRVLHLLALALDLLMKRLGIAAHAVGEIAFELAHLV